MAMRSHRLEPALLPTATIATITWTNLTVRYRVTSLR